MFIVNDGAFDVGPCWRTRNRFTLFKLGSIARLERIYASGDIYSSVTDGQGNILF